MIIWGALTIPIVCIVVLYIKYKGKTVFWEYLLPIALVLPIILISKFTGERVEVQDTEFWGAWLVDAAFDEPWNERVACQHPEYITVPDTCSNADGSTYMCTSQQYVGDEHAYDVANHGAQHEATDSNGQVHRIGRAKYQALLDQWGAPMFVELNRNYHTQDGDRYYKSWDKNPETMVTVTSVHAYENRVQGKNDLISWEEVTDEIKARYGLYDYPPIVDFSQKSVMGITGVDADQAESILSRANALMGKKHQVRMYVMVFVDQPEEAGYWQEQYLRGGNKNELISLIGIDSQGNVTWSRTVSWTEREDLKDQVAQHAFEYGTLSLVKHVDHMISQVEQNWERKQFEDFSFVKVTPPLWVTILSYVLSILGCLVLSIWIVMNGHSNEPKRRSRYGRLY
jgi:hypothetical protein